MSMDIWWNYLSPWRKTKRWRRRKREMSDRRWALSDIWYALMIGLIYSMVMVAVRLVESIAVASWSANVHENQEADVCRRMSDTLSPLGLLHAFVSTIVICSFPFDSLLPSRICSFLLDLLLPSRICSFLESLLLSYRYRVTC